MDDVLIVGGGPGGRFLAGELARAGCTGQVLEREPDSDAPWKSLPLGMRTLWDLSAEVFYRRGMLAEILTVSGSGKNVVLPRTVHFACILVDPDAIAVGRLPYRLRSPAPERIVTSLAAVESVLGERAAKLGATIRRGVEVSGVEPHDDHVVVRAGADEHMARWVVGCDGGRSTVRVAAGIGFEGTDPTFTGYTTHVTMDDPEKLRPGFHQTPWGLYRRSLRPLPGVDARAPAGGAAPGVRLRRDADRRPGCVHVHGPGAAGDDVPARAGVAGRGRRAHPLAAGRAGTQPRHRRRPEPGLEAGRNDPRAGAGRAAGHVHRGAAPDRRAGARLDPRPGGDHAAGPALAGGSGGDSGTDPDPGRGDLHLRPALRAVPALRPRQ